MRNKVAMLRPPGRPTRAFGWLATAFLACLSVLAAAPPANAQSPEPLEAPVPRHAYDVWSGLDTTSNATTAYTGLTYAPGGDLTADGLRLRMVAGGGRYRYTTQLFSNGLYDWREVSGEKTFAELLAGYQWSIGPATLKAFAGASWTDHRLSPLDPANRLAGEKFGVKIALETWINLTDRSWTSVDLTYATNHHDATGRLRYGYRITRGLSLGAEVGGHTNREYTGGLGGAFARYEWSGGEVSVSGGLTGDIQDPDTPYAALQVSQRF